MQISKRTRVLRALSIPLLFCGVAVGLVTVQTAIQRQAERAGAAAQQPQSMSAAHHTMMAGSMVSVADLSEAAGQGNLAARLEMGRRLAQGRGVEKNEGSAAAYFRGIISEYENISAHDKRGPHVAAAFLEMARLYKAGVPEANVVANPAQAFSFLHHAASYFGDPIAQFELAKLLMSGDGVTKNTRAAAQWLLSASRKGYAPAQAQLGDLLWRGGDGVRRVAGDGLGLLAIARRNAQGEDKVWVSTMFETARAEAQPIEILEANAFIVQELSSSHSALTSEVLINGESREGSGVAAAASALRASPADAAAPQAAAISGTSKALSELGASPMGFPQNPFDPELTIKKQDGGSAAGILQMYKPQSPQGRVEAFTPTRYAGVSN
ncbi:MAG TPA: tetratricopeptide repeat protein [Geobacterales bacterium]|nr:tetratricopeptide repeat protein [Geobacterales bacterium]